MPEAPRITAQELKRRMDTGEDFTIIDVRNPQAWGQSDTMIPEAIRIPLDEFETRVSLITKEQASRYLWALQGGFDAWRKAGHPVESKRKAA